MWFYNYIRITNLTKEQLERQLWASQLSPLPPLITSPRLTLENGWMENLWSVSSLPLFHSNPEMLQSGNWKLSACCRFIWGWSTRLQIQTCNPLSSCFRCLPQLILSVKKPQLRHMADMHKALCTPHCVHGLKRKCICSLSLALILPRALKSYIVPGS